MIPELGHFALILSLAFAIMLGTLPLIGAQRGVAAWIALARPLAWGVFVCMALSYLALTWSFIVHDFSVAYVAQNSNTKLPFIYLISGVWGAHEGSLLLWALILGLCGAAVASFSRSVPDAMVARVLAVMGLVSVGFLLFMLLTSNPFERLFNPPADGRDLNPLLQDLGLIIHPPLLYIGYVGFVVPFAFAIAAMLGGRLDAAWARWSRPWTNIAWLFLTLGIALGSWWAYYELGWGGWWFWDPVENASFMPWLVGTALMHSLAVTEKRGGFKAWTVLLAIFTFSLSLLGTFLVRSGVLTSVHAFATDPERGLFILIFLVVVVGSSLLLYAVRAADIRSRVRFELISRETGLLLNNVILVVAAVSVLLGTLYPLIIDALGYGKISVGPPYFNTVFIPLTAPLVVLVGIGILVRWKRDSVANLLPRLWPAAVAAIAAGLVLLLLFADSFSLLAWFGVTLAVWVVLMTLQGVREQRSNRRWRDISRGYWGMVLGHIGLAVFVIGVTLTSIYSTEKDVRLAPGESYLMGGYTFVFQGVKELTGPNYTAWRGEVDVFYGDEKVTHLSPEKRTYWVQTMPMTEAGIDPGLFRDLFVAIGEPLGESGAWSVRLYHKPFVRWLWFGALIMALGGGLAAFDKRYLRMAKLARGTVNSEKSEPHSRPIATPQESLG
ncbi:heme lyase CcmF/NrfE family subunit [Ectothiorhodospiraceae bacterium BW-2]|nr:heme lyase CcmF/NrfE family subunit [Ectothiorhodospiraceae bacterium BW-2]